MAKTKYGKGEKPTIICHETKEGIKCSYDGPIYTPPKDTKPKQAPKQTTTF
jgi:hypothetical protein